MEQINWVEARHNHTVRTLFELIVAGIEADVAARDAQVRERKINFVARRASDVIEVARFRDGELKETLVTIGLTQTGIEAKDNDGKLIASARPTLTLGSGQAAIVIEQPDRDQLGPVDEWVFRFFALQKHFGFDEV